MLIAIFAALMLAFGLGNDAAVESDLDRAIAAVPEVVPDRHRQTAALEMLGQMKNLVSEMAKPPRRFVHDLDSMLSRHRATADAIEQALDPILVHQQSVEERLVALRMRLRAEMSAAEWAGLFPPPDDA